MGLKERLENGSVLVLDGAMGTMIQTYGLHEEDYRGSRFADVGWQMMGNNDILALTRPDVIKDIHRRYLEAGADIITANTFSANRVCMADYHCEEYVAEINTAAIRLAKEAVEEYLAGSGACRTEVERPLVVSTIGPTNKSLSISPDVEYPERRSITFDELCYAYEEQMVSILQCGVDAIMLETIFDTLNCKAGIQAKKRAEERTGIKVPLMLSVTVNDKQGRLLSGQTLEAFLASVEQADILTVGLNCSFGAKDMLPCLRTLAKCSSCFVSAHPNAGLPNTFGGYDQTPQMMLGEVKAFIDEGLVNIVGGCCGTTPEHIKAMAGYVKGSNCATHNRSSSHNDMWLSGLELLDVSQEVGFVNVGERCNVAGSRKFLRLIKEGSYDEAVAIARKQVEDGALVLDLNMDDGMLDAEKEMTNFLNLIGSDPDVCRVPMMVDSSNWNVIRAGMKCIQGKGIVNSISLKEGEEVFLSHAKEIKEHGFAVVVMAFDEEGQATTYERRIAVCQRAYRLMVEKVGFNPADIIFDPNVLAVATGMPEHDCYAADFIRTVEWIRNNLPGAHVSGGVSNLSFSFRGNNYIREAMHAVFLYHARLKGMDFGIINPASKVTYTDIPEDHLKIIEAVICNPSAEASEALIALAQKVAEEAQAQADGGSPTSNSTQDETMTVEEKLTNALQKGRADRLEEYLDEALKMYDKAVEIIEGPLMDGMNLVGKLFGEGKMFLPQVVKAARTMKRAVAILQPYIEAQKSEGTSSAGKVLVATVKGDVHDIGKNIVAVVMACNGYEIIDLGVMVPAEQIVAKAKEVKPDVIGLSGLITPSLDEMINVVKELKRAGLNIPVMIGGATTSSIHTALKIAPCYDGPVVWLKDASQNVPMANVFINPETFPSAFDELKKEQSALRDKMSTQQPILDIDEARKRKPEIF